VGAYGTDPADDDTDGDGVSDGDEILAYGTSALLGDTDGDGCSDSLEIFCGSAATALDPNLQPNKFWVSFQPSRTERSDGYAPADDDPFTDSRGYGWLE